MKGNRIEPKQRTMFTLSTTARLLDCNIESVRSLHRKEIIVPTPYGYTFEQLVVMRIILLIRNELECRNFTFAEVFKQYLGVINDLPLLVFLDGHYLMLQAMSEKAIEQFLIPIDKELFVIKADREGNEFITKCWEKIILAPNFDNLIMIPIERVKRHIEQKAEKMGLSVSLANSKKLQFDEKGLLTTVAS